MQMQAETEISCHKPMRAAGQLNMLITAFGLASKYYSLSLAPFVFVL